MSKKDEYLTYLPQRSSRDRRRQPGRKNRTYLRLLLCFNFILV